MNQIARVIRSRLVDVKRLVLVLLAHALVLGDLAAALSLFAGPSRAPAAWSDNNCSGWH